MFIFNPTNNAVDVGVCEGRLTLTTAVPVTTSDVTGATTVYFTPYQGSRIALYDGSAWALYTLTERSLALGTLTNALPYDVFIYNNAGTLTLEFLAWSSTTARATALVSQDGVLSKTGALTRRYLGTFYTTATTTTEDSAANRYLWNYYNRVPRLLQRFESGTWTYTTLTWRQANAAAANQVGVVVGVAEVEVSLTLHQSFANTTLANYAQVAIGENSTTAPSSSSMSTTAYVVIANGGLITTAYFRKMPAVGWMRYVWLEEASAGGSGSWFGNGNGIQGSILG